VALIDVRDTGAVGARILIDPAPHAAVFNPVNQAQNSDTANQLQDRNPISDRVFCAYYSY
jgi:hypothetical protein